MLQRPHLPTPHFMRFSSVVKTASAAKPSFSSTGRVNLTTIGGPQRTATALSADGAVSSTTGVHEADLAVPVGRLAAGVDRRDEA